MPTGVSSLQYLPPDPPGPLKLDDSYLLVRIHDAQAFYPAPWYTRPRYLTVTSSVTSTFQPGTPTQSLHKTSGLRKNVVCRLGVGVNLTDWLPARSTDSLRVTLTFTVTRASPLNDLVDHIESHDLVAKVSMLQPEWAAAVKVTNIVGRMLGGLLGERGRVDIFSGTIDLNLSGLKAGYHAVIGSVTDEVWPRSLKLADGRLVDCQGVGLDRLSYVVLEVLAIERRGEEVARGEAWWELLQVGREQALRAREESEVKRKWAFDEWGTTLERVRALVRKDRGYLMAEADDIIRSVHTEVLSALRPRSEPESASAATAELPDHWRELLGVGSEPELQDAVRRYREALTQSAPLIQMYGA